MISRASTQARLTASGASPSRSSSARMMASPSRKTLRGAVLGQQLVDRIVEIQAEVGRRIHASLQQRPGQARGVADIGFENHVAQNFFFAGFCSSGSRNS